MNSNYPIYPGQEQAYPMVSQHPVQSGPLDRTNEMMGNPYLMSLINEAAKTPTMTTGWSNTGSIPTGGTGTPKLTADYNKKLEAENKLRLLGVIQGRGVIAGGGSVNRGGGRGGNSFYNPQQDPAQQDPAQQDPAQQDPAYLNAQKLNLKGILSERERIRNLGQYSQPFKWANTGSSSGQSEGSANNSYVPDWANPSSQDLNPDISAYAQMMAGL